MDENNVITELYEQPVQEREYNASTMLTPSGQLPVNQAGNYRTEGNLNCKVQ